jgi:hypothetical protein
MSSAPHAGCLDCGMTTRHPRQLALAVLAVAVLLGAVLRFLRVLGEDFPLNDGALFLAMAQDLRQSGALLPATTSYGGLGIPFAYPPLAIHAAVLLADIGVPLPEVLRLLPALLSTLTIVAFYRLALALLEAPATAAFATLAFALLPRTFTWFVMGGGLTRAPGLLFTLLALQQLVLLCRHGQRRHLLGVAAFGAATVLVHPENAWFATYSAALLLAVFGRTPRALGRAALAALGAAILSAPWWATVLHQHGLAPFTAVAASAGYDAFFSWTPIRTFTFTDEPHLRPFAMLGLLGVFAALAERRWWLPAWLVLVLAVNPRNGATSAMVPLALLAGIAIDRLLLQPLATRGRPGRAAAAALLVLLAGYGFLNARVALWTVPGLRQLSREERDTMAWIDRTAPATARFVVIDGAVPWFGVDAASEWFPVLARRPSVGTVQGTEWLPGGEFGRRMDRAAALLDCRARDAQCLDDWLARVPGGATHLFLTQGEACEPLLRSLRDSARWRLLLEQQGLTLWQRV